MQHFRNIKSLQEDMEALGLARPAPKTHGFAKESRDPEPQSIEESVDIDDLLEGLELDDDDLLESEEMDEGLVKQRLHRMKPGDRAKARLARRKKKAVINRQRRLKHKKSAYKLRQKRISALRKGRSAGARRRFVLKQAMGESVSLLESMKEMNLEVTGNIYSTLEEGFENVNEVASTLGRKFSVVEDIMLQLEAELPVEDPGSEYGYDLEPENAKEGGKTGDATDSADDAPDGNVDSEDDHPDNPTPKGNVKFEARKARREQDDEMDDDDDEEDYSDVDDDYLADFLGDEGPDYDDDEDDEDEMESKKSVKEEKIGFEALVKKIKARKDFKPRSGETEDEAARNIAAAIGRKKYGKAKFQAMAAAGKKKAAPSAMAASIDMADEMFNLRLEAQDAMAALKTSVITPAEAGNILRDMVQYLGGAMKMYMDLAQNIGKYAYAGIGAPAANPEMVRDNTSQKGHNYVGQDDLDTEPASPSQYTDRT